MDQPPLDSHYLVMHLGGAKHVRRRNEGVEVTTIAELGSITVVPVGTKYQWRTRGPIEFAHLYVPPSLLDHTAQRAGISISLHLKDAVGVVNPLLRALYEAMLREIAHGAHTDALYLDSLLDCLLLTALRHHTSARTREVRGTESLTGATRRRIADYIEANLSDSITLEQLRHLTGNSLYHFARAFRNAMGLPPHQYVLHRRIERAKALLAEGGADLELIAIQCGFRDRSHLSRRSSRLVGRSCSDYRRGVTS